MMPPPPWGVQQPPYYYDMEGHPAPPPPPGAYPLPPHMCPPAGVPPPPGAPPPPQVVVSSASGKEQTAPQAPPPGGRYAPSPHSVPPPPPANAPPDGAAGGTPQSYEVEYHLHQGEVISLQLGDGRVEIIPGKTRPIYELTLLKLFPSTEIRRSKKLLKFFFLFFTFFQEYFLCFGSLLPYKVLCHEPDPWLYKESELQNFCETEFRAWSYFWATQFSLFLSHPVLLLLLQVKTKLLLGCTCIEVCTGCSESLVYF